MGRSASHQRSIRNVSTISTRPACHACASWLHYGELTDAANLTRVVQETQPDDIYNFAAQSHVQVSLKTPEYPQVIHMFGMERKPLILPGTTFEI